MVSWKINRLQVLVLALGLFPLLTVKTARAEHTICKTVLLKISELLEEAAVHVESVYKLEENILNIALKERSLDGKTEVVKKKLSLPLAFFKEEKKPTDFNQYLEQLNKAHETPCCTKNETNCIEDGKKLLKKLLEMQKHAFDSVDYINLIIKQTEKKKPTREELLKRSESLGQFKNALKQIRKEATQTKKDYQSAIENTQKYSPKKKEHKTKQRKSLRELFSFTMKKTKENK